MLTIYKDGEIWRQAKDERALFIATYESEKRKKHKDGQQAIHRGLLIFGRIPNPDRF